MAELNGAVEFTAAYSSWSDAFVDTARALFRDVEERGLHTAPDSLTAA